MTDDVLGSASDKAVQDDALGGNPDVEDITAEVTLEDFDFDAFMDGVRPGRRAVRVTARADLVAETEKLVIRFDDLGDKEGPEADALLEEYKALTSQILDSRKTFVVEARSDHRRREVAKQMEKLGITEPGKKASDEAWADYNRELALHCLADGIVVPSNISVDGLRKLYMTASSEVDKLAGAFHDASNNPTKGVDPNLSLRR